MRIIWLSRHEMTRIQEKRLRELLPEENRDSAEIVCRMHIWQVTDDEASDNEVNSRSWLELSRQADVIAGVFPPVAVVGLIMARGEADDNADFKDWSNPMVVTPISQVNQVLQGGKTCQRFNFLRWQHL